MKLNNLVFTSSGVRGIAGESLNIKFVRKLSNTYGLWLQGAKQVVIGRDTRPSSKLYENAAISGLIETGCEVINLEICPAPVIIYMKNKLNISGGIIISGSHNPPNWNGLKFISEKTFINDSEIKEILNIFNKIDSNYIKKYKSQHIYTVKTIDPNPDYIKAIYKNVDYQNLKKNNNLKVVVDTGAGSGRIITPQTLRGLGCEVKVINNDLDENNNFPRGIEPIEENLNDLITTIRDGNYDIGFAHDSDADRLTIVGDDSICYPEDISLALIADYMLKQSENANKKVIFVTNLASSLQFEAITNKYNAEVVRTPIGEIHLAQKLDKLINEYKGDLSDLIIFGGEGSCGGIMFPQFNNTRDGIFAAAKIVEILVKTREKVSTLINRLPKFYNFRKIIALNEWNKDIFIKELKDILKSEDWEFSQFGRDIRISQNNEWFVLIHPSNTEPVIRIIAEGKNKNKIKEIFNETAKIVSKILLKLKND
ncbi:MAG: hypothetical protein ACFFBP_21800 [Promethearchaeota archaeon]